MSRFILPFQSVFDSNGHPLDGAKLYFYATGTSTPKDTYSNAARTTANANPVIANSQGEFGDIFLNGEYRVELKDKNDVTQPGYPEDNVSPSDAGLRDELIASTGSQLVNYDQGSANAETRTVEDKLTDIISVKDFGALGDGVDDTVAVNNAISYGIANTLDVYFPAGTYRIIDEYLSCRELDCNNITIYGEGENSIILGQSSGGRDVFQLNNVTNLTVKDLAVTTTIITPTDQGSNGFSITGTSNNIEIRNVLCYDLNYIDVTTNLDGGAAFSVQTSDFDNIRIIDCKAINCSNAAAWSGIGPTVLTLKPRSLTFDRCHFESCYRGFSIGVSDTETIPPIMEGLSISVLNNHTINCQQNAFGRVTGLIVSNNVMVNDLTTHPVYRATDTDVYGMALAGIHRSIIANNNIFVKTGDSAMRFTAIVGTLGTSGCTYNTISNNTISIDTASSGYALDNILTGGVSAGFNSFVGNNIIGAMQPNLKTTILSNTFLEYASIITQKMLVGLDGAETTSDVALGVNGKLGFAYTGGVNCASTISRVGLGIDVHQGIASAVDSETLTVSNISDARVWGVRADGAMMVKENVEVEGTSYTGSRMPVYDVSNVLIGYVNIYD